jgi:E3 ubiquitin-protein ligase TRIP12
LHAGPLTVDGVPVEDLCLSFVLPGYTEYELRPGGADIAIDGGNCAAYVAAVVDATLGSGIARQVAAFRAGFEEVFPLHSLNAFYEDEIEAMLCGTGEKWTVEMLGNTIKFDHGYGRDSPAVGHFLRLLAALDSPDQRRFLRFVTGSPRLPPGGLAALQPRLTVVRKHSAASGALPDGSLGSSLGASLGAGGGASTAADGDLPSVMTCANYVKLPPYSSYEVLRERVLFAVREGQGSFDLS